MIMSRTLKTAGALAATAIVLGMTVGAAQAGPVCTTDAKDKWMTEQAMKDKITAAGFKIKKFLTSGSCYEIYGWNKAGKRAEVYFNPVTGAVVKAEIG
jgi:hypothetical protein